MDELRHRRHPWRRILHLELPRKFQLPLTCLSIALSAAQANGTTCWPTYGPVVAERFDLDAAEAQTIVVGGILGVYLMAAPLGAINDRYGPRACGKLPRVGMRRLMAEDRSSLCSAVLSAVGYLGFAARLSTLASSTPFIHLYLASAYFCVGAATVGAYFAALTCSSLSFPSHPTIALSIPLSLIGLSSLFLSSFSYLPTFLTPSSSPTHELNATKFLIFLGIFSPTINLFSALFMRVLPPRPAGVKLVNVDERTPLLVEGPEAAREEVEEMERGKEVSWTAWGLLKDWDGFWAFGVLLAFCIGPAETVVATIGSILTSLLPPTTSTTPSSLIIFTSFLSTAPLNPLALRNKHVRILSLTSTLARLLTGFSADYLSPPLVAIPNPAFNPDEEDNLDIPEHLFIRKRKVRLSRSAFAAVCSLVLAGVFAWCAGWLGNEGGLWVLSGGVGALYGALFTLTPAIVSAHFGPTNFGLAWGMVSYFAALGSVLFSYLYALIAEVVARQDSGRFKNTEPIMCYGPRCFRLTLWVGAGCCVLASIGLSWLGRRWRV